MSGDQQARFTHALDQFDGAVAELDHWLHTGERVPCPRCGQTVPAVTQGTPGRHQLRGLWCAEQAGDAVTDEALLADLRRVCATADPPPTALPWSNPAADPIADMREWWERAMDVPYRMGGPVLSPQLKAALDREMVRVNERHRIDQFRREIAWRRYHAKRLTPMYAAYRHRARRRSR